MLLLRQNSYILEDFYLVETITSPHGDTYFSLHFSQLLINEVIMVMVANEVLAVRRGIIKHSGK